jgi:hypothetical protein
MEEISNPTHQMQLVGIGVTAIFKPSFQRWTICQARVVLQLLLPEREKLEGGSARSKRCEK